jgi:hypothetical protein
MISVRAVRWSAIGVCVAGIAGMIVTNALNDLGAAITFGLVTAVAILCLMVATSVAADTIRRAGSDPVDDVDERSEAMAAAVEDQVKGLVATGADEQAVRQLVGEAVRLGRTLGQPHS